MDLSQLLRALGLQAYQSYQENVGQPFANVAGPFGRGLLGLEKPEYGEEQAYRTGQAVGNIPAVGAPVGAFKAAAQVPGLLVDASQAIKGLDLAGLLGLLGTKVVKPSDIAKVKHSEEIGPFYHSTHRKDLEELGFAVPKQGERGDPRGVFMSQYPQSDYGSNLYELYVPKKAIKWDIDKANPEFNRLTDAIVPPEFANLIRINKMYDLNQVDMPKSKRWNE